MNKKYEPEIGALYKLTAATLVAKNGKKVSVVDEIHAKPVVVLQKGTVVLCLNKHDHFYWNVLIDTSTYLMTETKLRNKITP